MRFYPAVLLSAAVLFNVIAASAQVAGLSPCDLNKDGTTNVVDGQLAVNMTLGVISCTAPTTIAGGCNADLVKKITDAAIGRACVTGSTAPPPPGSHSVSLTWIASTSNVAGYHVYRSASSGGPYSKLTSVPVSATSYTDSSVQAGATYYYVATAVGSANNESGYSVSVKATVPTP